VRNLTTVERMTSALLASVMAIGLIAGGGLLTSGAYFTDSEESTDNALRCWTSVATTATYAIAYGKDTGSDYAGFLVTMGIASDGQIADTVIDNLEFDTTRGQYPNMIPVSGDIYAIAYTGDPDDGFLETLSIAPGGTISTLPETISHTLEFDDSAGLTPNIIPISDDVYAIAYRGKGDDGFLKTVRIAADGDIAGVLNSLEFDTTVAATPNIIHVAGETYAIAYWGSGGDGFLKTVGIAPDGTINGVLCTLVFDDVMGQYPNIIHVSGDVYAIAYVGPYQEGYLRTVEIASDGTIATLPVEINDTLVFDNGLITTPNIVNISGNVYAIAYTGPSSHGFLKTVGIAADGNIAGVLNSLEFDDYQGLYPNILHVSGDVYAIAYKGTSIYYEGENVVVEPSGLLSTVAIATNGTITPVIDIQKFDSGTIDYPNIISVSSHT